MGSVRRLGRHSKRLRLRRQVVRRVCVGALILSLVLLVAPQLPAGAAVQPGVISLGLADFANGTFSNTEVADGALRLQQASLGSGTWTSPVYDTGGTSLWGWFSADQDLSGAQNLQTNGGFETDVSPADGIPDGWSYSAAAVQRSTTNVRSGSYSLKLDAPDFPSGGVYHTYAPPFPVVDGRTYHVITHATGDVAESVFAIGASYYQTSTQSRVGSVRIQGNFRRAGAHFPNGTVLHHTFTVTLPPNADAVQLGFPIGGRGPVWIDDIMVYDSPTLSLETQTSNDNVAWSPWASARPVYDNRIGLGSVAGRYIKFRLTLATPSPSWNPSVRSAQLTYARAFPFPVTYGNVARKFFSPQREVAGSRGAVRARQDGNLEFADGTPAKFWATQVMEVVGSSLEACKLAEAYGFNMLKNQLTHAANQDLLTFEVIDAYDRQIADCKQRGVYLYLRYFPLFRIMNDLNLPDHAKLAADGVGSEVFFDSAIIDHYKQYTTDLLTHVNPYTGLAIGADPAVVFIEYLNEFGVIQAFTRDRLHGECLNIRLNPQCGWPRDIGPEHVLMLNQQWNAWLRSQYANRAALETFWQQSGRTGLLPAEDPWACNVGETPPNCTGNVARIRYADVQTYSRARFRDLVAFYVSLEENFFTTMQVYVNNLRQSLGGAPLTIGNQGLVQISRAGIKTQLPNDVIDVHSYFDHYGSGVAYQRLSQITDPTLATMPLISRGRALGRPYTVSEHNQIGYTDFTAEMPPFAGAYGAYQNYTMITNFIFGTALFGDFYIDNFDPVRLAQLPVAANLFLRDVRPAQQTIPLVYTPQETLDIDTPQYGLTGWREDQTILFDEYSLLRGVGVQQFDYCPTPPNCASPTPADYVASNNLPANPASPYVTDTGELTLDSVKEFFKVETAGTQGVVGALSDTTTALPNLTIDVPQTTLERTSVFLTAVGADSIANASSLLLTAVTKSEPTGQTLSIDKRERTAAGDLPILTAGVAATLTIPTDRVVQVFALDENGNRKTEVPVSSAAGQVQFSIDPEYETVWYEVVATADTTPPSAVTDLNAG